MLESARTATAPIRATLVVQGDGDLMIPTGSAT
jgi:hypothetical protein